MPKRDTVQPNVDSIAEKVSAKSWSEASFSKNDRETQEVVK